MAKTCRTVRELLEFLRTLPPDTPVNPQLAKAGVRTVLKIIPYGHRDEAEAELHFEPPDWGEE